MKTIYFLSNFNSEPSISVLLGVLSLLGFFALSVVFTLGIKSAMFFLRKKLSEKPTKKAQKPQERTRKPIKSIEINPEEVDRISFKKY